jgi:hypothetical protein
MVHFAPLFQLKHASTPFQYGLPILSVDQKSSVVSVLLVEFISTSQQLKPNAEAKTEQPAKPLGRR